ncbi:hypothetical protein AgCh_038282 [Apium graveolens]
MYDGLIIKWTQGTGYSGKLDRKVTDKIKCFAAVDEEIVPSVYDNKASYNVTTTSQSVTLGSMGLLAMSSRQLSTVGPKLAMRFFRDSQGRVPVSSVSGSSEEMPPKKATQSNENSSSLAEGPVINEILDLLRQHQQQQLQLIQQIQQQQHQQGELNQTTSFKSFQSIKPPEFKGEVDPVVARNWLKEIEKAFTLTQVSDDLKTDYASYFLMNEANYWWESTRALEGEGHVSWTRFTELFLEKYFPDGLRNQLEVEFLELKQGERSVLEYEAKFTELARLVPEYAALVLESDQNLAVKEENDKKRKSDDAMDKADQEESSQQLQNLFS